ncbi:hypothetical protein SAMN05660489_04522 [Pseudomonas sp. LAMO17WK12:I10]|uniref:hypothetical protein n=1 Tax=unclassified Pseudomonas TaxID=196821 RepID=UPI000BDD1615|nr:MULTISPECIES: hypothetical protein [unclassified Pseudomonas]PXX59497.1 hypothetical protein H160_04617 [Pseudomonas sp. LAMO17WK12:I9]SNY46592.1 hypothetical protein SAMN05660489_04522 [Pseudomonas sp. LAMO17WK12:I10]
MHTQTPNSNTPANVATRFDGSENVSRFREGKVYAAVFSDGWIKVGRGRCPESRIVAHSSVSAMRNATLLQFAVSGELVDSASAEADLIKFCSERCHAVHGREWFTEVDFEGLRQLITERYSGNSQEDLRDARAAKSKRVDQMLEAVFRLGADDRQASVDGPEDQLKWSNSLAYARIIDRIYLDDCYSGWLFEASSSGMSNFGNYASLVLHSLDDSEVADVFCRAATSPGEVLEYITETARSIIDTYQKARGA